TPSGTARRRQPRRVVPRGVPGDRSPRPFVAGPIAVPRRSPTEECVTTGSYRAVPPQVDLPAMEREILRFWPAQDTSAKSLAATADGPPWVFYEGPPTANGKPGTHHIEARVFKDVFPRFKTMKGYHVGRKAGWDCHGLPVELAVETELG